MGEIGRTLLVIAALLAVAGVLLMGSERFPGVTDLWRRFPLGRLPGDIYIDRPGFKFYFPFTSGIVVSVVVGLLVHLFRK